MHYQGRCYAPAIGRFVSTDTIVPDSGNPQDLNRYTYVRSDPVHFDDPTRHTQGIEIPFVRR